MTTTQKVSKKSPAKNPLKKLFKILLNVFSLTENLSQQSCIDYQKF